MVGPTDSEEELVERSVRDAQRAVAAVGQAWQRVSNAVRESTPARLAFRSRPLLPVHQPAQPAPQLPVHGPLWQPPPAPLQPPPTQLRRHRAESCPTISTHAGDVPCDICDYGHPPPDSESQDGDIDDMAADSPASKSTAPASSSTYDVDAIVPLLLATLDNPSISYKKMAAMDPQGHTEFAFQHKFRKWRQEAREIALKNPDHAGPVKPITPKKPRNTKAANGKQAETAEDDQEGEFGAAIVKQEANSENGDDDTKPTVATNGKGKGKAGKSTAGKAGNQANGANKRGTSKELDEDIKGNESPTKKSKVNKKGMAKVVKKPGRKPRETIESVSESSSESEDNGVSVPATKGKGKAKANPKGRGATKENKSPAKKGNGKASSSKQGSVAPEKEEGPVDGGENDYDMEGKTEMQFDI